MLSCRLFVAIPWHLSVHVLAIILSVLPCGYSEVASNSGHSVSQRNRLRVHDSGRVDVVMTITFHVEPGALLEGSHKSILHGASSKIDVIEQRRVTATDGSGLSLQVSTSDQHGWLRADFKFAHLVNGSATPHYEVNLAYTIHSGVCMGPAGVDRLNLPWAHRWAVKVTASQYEIEFASPKNEEFIEKVCFGSSGFSLKCGRRSLTVTGQRAGHHVSGNHLSAFFEWAHVNGTNPGRSRCDPNPGEGKQISANLSASRSPSLVGRNQTLSQAQEASTAGGTALTVGLVAISSSCLLAGAALACGKRMPVHGGKLAKGAEQGDTIDLDLEKQMPMDLSAVAAELRSWELASSGSIAGIEPTSHPVAGAGVGKLACAGGSVDDWEVMEEFPGEPGAPVHESTSPVAHRAIGGSLKDWEVMDEFTLDKRSPQHESMHLDLSSIVSDAQPNARQAPCPPPSSPTGSDRAVSQLSEVFEYAQASWEVMPEFGADDVVERDSMTQAPFEVTQSSSAGSLAGIMAPCAEGGNEEPTREVTATLEEAKATWQVKEEFTDTEPAVECQGSLVASVYESAHHKILL